MTKMATYDPEKFQVPAGNYVARLKEIKEKPPFEGPSKFGKNDNEPRYGWQFEVLTSPGDPSNANVGKILEQGTGTYLSPRSGLVRLLTMLMGRAPMAKEQIDLDSFVGRSYQVLWAVNPKSDSGNLYIASLMEVGKSPMANSSPPGANPTPAAPPSASAQRAPTPTPPPRNSSPAQAAPPAKLPPEPSFWVQIGDSEPVLLPKADAQAAVNVASEPVVMMPEDQSGGWKDAAEMGFKSEIRF